MPAEKRRRAGGLRRWVLAAILASGVAAGWTLHLDPRDLIPGSGGLNIARDFFSRALTPALTYEAAFVPADAPPLWLKTLGAIRTTVVFAAAAISLSVLLGLGLGFLGSTAWWAGDPVGGRSRGGRLGRRAIPLAIYGGTRTIITLMRSIHELLWAVLFLAAFGLSNLAAVIAIAIPYGGTFAKVFSELIDEAPAESGRALRAAGAAPMQVFFFGLLPRALPDMIAYTLYRFECSLRSAAVLGFFGYPTLGYYLAASFENLHYGEVWTYLYALFLLVIVVEWWSSALRRRLVV